MKKRILLFTSSIVLLAGTIMSYQQGPAHANTNYTGGPGSAGTCANSGCHGTGGTNPTSYTVVLRKASTGAIVLNNVYNPDTMYTVTMIGINTNMALTHFGFNLMALDSNATTVNAGTFSNFPATVDDATVGGRLVVEHNNGSLKRNVNTTFTVTFNWKAPSAGMGTIGFFGILNAVDSNNLASTVDICSAPATDYFKEASPTSVAELNADIKINAYPNPMTDKLNISLENAENGVYSISVFDMHGKVVATQTASVNKSFSTSVNASAWAAGMYHVQLKKGDAQRTIAVVKQ